MTITLDPEGLALVKRVSAAIDEGLTGVEIAAREELPIATLRNRLLRMGFILEAAPRLRNTATNQTAGAMLEGGLLQEKPTRHLLKAA